MEEEIVVAGILLELPRLILLSELRPRFSSTWGLKRKRSVSPKQMFLSAATSPPSLEQSSSSSSPPLLTPAVDVSSTEGPIEKVILSSSSPDTPLSFFPSELDEKPLPSKKKTSVITLKRKRDQLLEMVDDFTYRNELLKKDIEIKRKLLNQQITENLELKSKKQKLTSKKYEDHQQQQQQSFPSSIVFHQQALMMDQMVRMVSRLPSDGVGSSKVIDKVEPHHGTIDLNIPAIDFDRVSKSMAAEARLKRKQICKAKVVDKVEPLGSSTLDLNIPAIDFERVSKSMAAEARLKRKQICRAKNLNAVCKAQ